MSDHRNQRGLHFICGPFCSPSLFIFESDYLYAVLFISAHLQITFSQQAPASLQASPMVDYWMLRSE